MVMLAQLVRASGCGPEGCRFKSGTSPNKLKQHTMVKNKMNSKPVEEESEPRVPADLQKALAAVPPLVEVVWKSLTPLARWDFVSWIDSAKQPELSKSRAGQACELLAAGKQRP